MLVLPLVSWGEHGWGHSGVGLVIVSVLWHSQEKAQKDGQGSCGWVGPPRGSCHLCPGSGLGSPVLPALLQAVLFGTNEVPRQMDLSSHLPELEPHFMSHNTKPGLAGTVSNARQHEAREWAPSLLMGCWAYGCSLNVFLPGPCGPSKMPHEGQGAGAHLCWADL